MEFVNNLVIFSFLLLMLIPIFFVVYGIYHKIRYRKICILRTSFTLVSGNTLQYVLHILPLS